MGSKPFKNVCFLWVTTLYCISAANENDAIQFPSTNPRSDWTSTRTRTNERFPIPEVTQDPYYNPLLADMVATNVMQFAHDLGVVLDQDEFPNTQIFSPLSIMSALSMLQMGASGNTYQQFSKLFPMLAGSSGDSRRIHQELGWMLQDIMLNQKNLQRPRDEVAWRKTPANLNAFGKGGKKTPNEHTIRVANGLFIQEGYSLSPNYKFAAQSVYRGEVIPLDFKNQRGKAKHYINSWVSQNTLGKIPAIITDEIQRDTEMILASALYFKGYWQQPFLGSGTAETNFYPDGPQQPPVRVMMMSFGGVLPFYDAPEYGCRIIGLPYKGNLTTMYVIQPYESTRLKLYYLQNILTGDRINEIIAKMEQKTAVVAFPKFHVTNSLNLKKPLKLMGFRDVFLNGVSDLSLIADQGRYVNRATSGNPPLSSAQRARTIHGRPSVQRGTRSIQSSAEVNRTTGCEDPWGDPLLFLENVTVPKEWYKDHDVMPEKPTFKYKVESEFMRPNLSLKDLILDKRLTKSNLGKKYLRSRRQTPPESYQSLYNLDQMRYVDGLRNPNLYVDEILHKVDFDVNEQGTEAAAVTATFIRRSGTDVAFRCDTPFMVLIRHDPTKLPLFYGKVNIPLP